MQIQRRVHTFVAVPDLTPVYFVIEKEDKITSNNVTCLNLWRWEKKGNVNTYHKNSNGRTDGPMFYT